MRTTRTTRRRTTRTRPWTTRPRTTPKTMTRMTTRTMTTTMTTTTRRTSRTTTRRMTARRRTTKRRTTKRRTTKRTRMRTMTTAGTTTRKRRRTTSNEHTRPPAPPSALDQGPRPHRRELRAASGPDAGARSPHGLRRGSLSERRRVLEPRDGNLHDPGRRLHPGLRVLRREDGAPRATPRPRGTPPRGERGGAHGAAPRRDHLREPGRPAGRG